MYMFCLTDRNHRFLLRQVITAKFTLLDKRRLAHDSGDVPLVRQRLTHASGELLVASFSLMLPSKRSLCVSSKQPMYSSLFEPAISVRN